jgi:hypothetical protein
MPKQEVVMNALRRASLFAALAALFLSGPATGQQLSTDSLLRRIDHLERTTIELEQRVRELEALIRTEPSQGRPAAVSRQWRDIQNWRRLRMGMTMDQVRAILGEPERVVAGSRTMWHWGDTGIGHVTFDRSGRVDGWWEPGR